MKWLYAIVVQTYNICNLSCRMDATLEKLFLGWIRNHLQNLGRSFFQGSCKERSLSWKSSVSLKYPILFPYCMMPCVYLLCCSFGGKCQSSSFQLFAASAVKLANLQIMNWKTYPTALFPYMKPLYPLIIGCLFLEEGEDVYSTWQITWCTLGQLWGYLGWLDAK